MTTGQALLVYLIFIIFVFALFIHMRIKILSALVLTLLLGQILLNVICSPSQITPWSPNGESITSASALYIMIQIIPPIIAIIYIVIKCWNDRVQINESIDLFVK
jgi:ABC-type transport system involved in cytochrome c biogenesis permease component